jgi:hypothetical protein
LTNAAHHPQDGEVADRQIKTLIEVDVKIGWSVVINREDDGLHRRRGRCDTRRTNRVMKPLHPRLTGQPTAESDPISAPANNALSRL